ncbi:hypothetical protein LTR56_005796 [Elasticomyces elasticus]|nr:hypothetical protein LTR22_019446 [Elasticomyces elasticus]KAK3651339.1 hypothetical protein LTR56_005796 [Elasticomyces elasticus]KAK4925727.1 hypothetical protein LTR49_007337 [Elasticomyces elasticus]KAK5765059.1 hypothetical protein LTS12_004837 [Elasticomyces elasticus]
MTNEKPTPGVGINSRSTTSYFNSSTSSMEKEDNIVEDLLEGIFFGPRDIVRHSKWPYFLRLQGSVLPRMIIPLTFVAAWATTIVCISKLVHDLGISSVLLTITGFVVGLALSFRSSTAYERYSEGRKYWSQLLLTSRNMARLIWVHVQERKKQEDGTETPEVAKKDLLNKLAAINLLNAFAVALKHRLRFEPSVEYPDLAPYLTGLDTLAGKADQAELRHRKPSTLKAAGQYLGISFAESNPRKVIKRAKHNLGNTPLEVLTYLSAYFEHVHQAKMLALPVYQTQTMNNIAVMGEVLAGVERVVNTPLPIAYSISISQITWAYVLALPFQLVETLGWVAIPGTIMGGYIILGLAAIGRELENPFGQDVNDLPLDAYCHELASDIDALISRPPPLNMDDWMSGGGAKIMWPLSGMEYKGWESKSVEDIRDVLKAKSASIDVKRERVMTLKASEALTPGV